MLRSGPIAALYHKPWPLTTAVASHLDPSRLIEEEKTPNYHPDRFYPARLGQVLSQRYQLATKIGYGANSTVWLARDLHRWRWFAEKYVAIKLNAAASPSRRVPADNEAEILRHISRVNPRHKGWHFIRKLNDSFKLKGASGDHSCLVLEPLREPLWVYRERYIDGVIPSDILKIQVQMILHALDYLHSECHIIHTDLKPDNIMVKIEDPSIFERGVRDEYEHPLPQKHTDGRIIYLSRNNFGPLAVPTGIIQLVDFDLAVSAKPGHLHLGPIQGEIYRAPEVILNSGYTFSADIWSLGVLLWDLLEGKGLFDPRVYDKTAEYDEKTHLGQITSLIGSAPIDLISAGQRSSMFYSDDGSIENPTQISSDFNFESTIHQIKGEEKRRFIGFIKRMVKWRPEERNTAKELLDDPWLHEDFPQD